MLLKIPRELRDEIYRQYLLIGAEYGYVYDFEAGKLRGARAPPVDVLGNVPADNQEPIDLSLMYTCRQVAAEMRGLALQMHTITFTTLYSEELSSRAGQWDFISAHRSSYFRRALSSAMSRMSDAMVKDAQTLLSGKLFAPFLNIRRGELSMASIAAALAGHYDSGVLSVNHEITRQIFNLAITDPEIHDYFVHEHWNWPAGYRSKPETRRYNPSLVFNYDKEGWKIPTEEELDSLVQELPTSLTTGQAGPLMDPGHWKTSVRKYRFSAAAAATHFLKTLSPVNRQHLRKVVVHEDRRSVASAQCHVQGLVPFCQENDKLTIERRVSFWRVVILDKYLVGWPIERRYTDGFNLGTITRQIAEWVSEASLPQIPEAITLLLDAGPIPEKATEIFQSIVHNELGLREADDRCCASEMATGNDVSPEHLTGRLMHLRFKLLAKSLREPSLGVRYNFDTGKPYDDAQIEALRKTVRPPPIPGVLGLRIWQWKYYNNLLLQYHNTVAPMPTVGQLIEEMLKIPLQR